MYPAQDLKRLATRKIAVRREIAVQRARCELSVSRLARPLEWLDRVLTTWRRMAPLARFAAVPLTFLLTRSIFSRLRFLGPLVRWAPMVFSAARGIGTAFKTHSRRASR